MEKPIIRSSKDLLLLPNYLDSIDPSTQPLRRIITGYYLNAEYPCGLKNCHQPHREGFLVELEDGNISNVGWKCGEHFGEKFAIERTRYAELELRPKAIAIVQSVLTRLRSSRQELDRLAAEADRLSRCKLGMRRQFPKLYSELERRAHGGNDRVTEQIERTRQEIDDLQAMNPSGSRDRFRYREESRGVLPGLRVLATNIRDEIVVGFTNKADSLVETDIASLSTDKLLEWERWALDFDETMKRAQDIVAWGNAFFSQESFRLQAYVATVSAEKMALSKVTSAALLRENTYAPNGVATNPAVLTKKQRDAQKRLAATLEFAKRRK